MKQFTRTDIMSYQRKHFTIYHTQIYCKVTTKRGNLFYRINVLVHYKKNVKYALAHYTKFLEMVFQLQFNKDYFVVDTIKNVVSISNECIAKCYDFVCFKEAGCCGRISENEFLTERFLDRSKSVLY